jgi:hypothetical protein
LVNQYGIQGSRDLTSPFTSRGQSIIPHHWIQNGDDATNSMSGKQINPYFMHIGIEFTQLNNYIPPDTAATNNQPPYPNPNYRIIVVRSLGSLSSLFWTNPVAILFDNYYNDTITAPLGSDVGGSKGKQFRVIYDEIFKPQAKIVHTQTGGLTSIYEGTSSEAQTDVSYYAADHQVIKLDLSKYGTLEYNTAPGSTIPYGANTNPPTNAPSLVDTGGYAICIFSDQIGGTGIPNYWGVKVTGAMYYTDS